ncbi:lariat debranching enzyme-like protein [Sarcoptes scabiei]|uniref:Lariat debranching enzyme-like protein n=1 Tax=Sarcoptes scabiei TaxID=52283 RepID=A0A132AAL7_SARSC|nr:lariat debranching enzyme-like protein [Sarcoptes scabiei]
MKIAAVGCLHGQLDVIYEKIDNIEKNQNITIDLVLVCGDVQTIRNENDFHCISVPPKYRQLGTFHQYYFGEKIAPKLTLLIGGNHEASNVFQTLPYGGWVAPNMYYMGYCSVVKFGSFRIGGVSGIFKNVNNLLQRKPHFRLEIEQNRFGNPLLQPLVNHLRPKHWFAAHMHAGFRATVIHQPTDKKDSTDDQKEQSIIKTEFQALDKVLFKRYFLHVTDINFSGDEDQKPPCLEYDPEWLVILKKTDNLWIEIQNPNGIDLLNSSNKIEINQKDLDEIAKDFENDFRIPENFQCSSPVLIRNEDSDPERRRNYLNPQTTKFCSKLNIFDPNTMFIQQESSTVKNPDEIDLDESDDEEDQNHTESEPTQKKRLKTELFIIDTKGTLCE